MKKAIVTGGAGFIGSNLVSFLLTKNWKVIVIDDFSVGKRSNLPTHQNLKIVKADIRDRKLMLKVVKNVDLVFHLAVQCVRKSINNPWFVHRVNCEGTLALLEAALANKIKKFIYVSSSEVYGTGKEVPMSESSLLKPTTIYGASKLAGEFYSLAYLRVYRLPVVVVRPFNTYGYHEHFEGPYGEVIPRFVTRALNNLPLQIFGDGKQTRDFTFVDDTVKGIYLISQKGKIGEIYNLARGKEVSIKSLAGFIQGELKLDVGIEYLKPRPGDVRRHFANIKKSRKLGFIPKVSIKEGLKRYIIWFRKEIPDPKKAIKYYAEKNW